MLAHLPRLSVERETKFPLHVAKRQGTRDTVNDEGDDDEAYDLHKYKKDKCRIAFAQEFTLICEGMQGLFVLARVHLPGRLLDQPADQRPCFLRIWPDRGF